MNLPNNVTSQKYRGHFAGPVIRKSIMPLLPVTSPRIQSNGSASSERPVLTALNFAFCLTDLPGANGDNLDPRPSKQLRTVKFTLEGPFILSLVVAQQISLTFRCSHVEVLGVRLNQGLFPVISRPPCCLRAATASSPQGPTTQTSSKGFTPSTRERLDCLEAPGPMYCVEAGKSKE